MKKYRLRNLDCQNCAANLQASLQKMPTVQSVSIDFSTQTILLDCQNLEMVRQEIARIEPEVRLEEIDRSSDEAFSEVAHHRQELLLLGFSTVLFIVAMFVEKLVGHSFYHFWEYALYLPVYIVAGGKVINTAIRNIRQGRVFDENFLMTISTLGAMAIHFPAEAVGVMLFYRLGEFLQEVSVQRSRRSIKALLEMRPEQANLVENGKVRGVAPEHVTPGNMIIVKPGERVPLDGVVHSGQSLLDTTALTGEPVPRSVKEKDTVLAGMINKQGLLTIEVTRHYKDSSLAKILELVENAQHKKAGTELFFTTFARYYTPVVVALAALVAILPPLLLQNATFPEWLYRALMLLVISCPCALVVSIPLTYFATIGAASRKGILIKGSGFLDALLEVKNIFLDKTGTLTKGVFRVLEICPEDTFSKDGLLELAALAETQSNHPIAISIRDAYGNELDHTRIQTYEELEGNGVRALIDEKIVLAGNDRMLHRFEIPHPLCEIPGTVVHLAVDGKYAGYLIIGDAMKEDSATAIAELRKLGIKDLTMLTGDNQNSAAIVAKELGLTSFQANLLPEEKVKVVEDALLQCKQNEKVIFVGDGVNDAPVLTRADIGVSMGGLGADAAIETADIVIMNDSLSNIPLAIRLAKKNRQILVQNITFALVVKVIIMACAVSGQANLWQAVFADIGVALIAIFNAVRRQ